MFRKIVPILSVITILLVLPGLPTQVQVYAEDVVESETPGRLALALESTFPLPNTPPRAGAATATASPKSTPPLEPWSPKLVYPIHGLLIGVRRPVFDWSDVPGVGRYTIQVSKTSDFSSLLVDASVSGSSFRPASPLPRYVMLYWRVRSEGAYKPSKWSSARFWIMKITRTDPVTVTVIDIYSRYRTGVNVSAFIGNTYTGYQKITDVGGQAAFALPHGLYRFRVDYYDKSFWSGIRSHCVVPGCQAVVVIVGPEPTVTPTYEHTPTATPR